MPLSDGESMKIGDIGERGFLSRIQDLVGQVHGARLGWDEDASDFPLGVDSNVVVNVDTFVESTDRLPGMTDAQVGRKTAVMTISDLVAKGARPIASMLSLCVPRDYALADAVELVRGFSDYGLKNGIRFIGGDTGSATDGVLTGVALGVAHPDRIVTRSGSQAGDLIAVTDQFGFTSVAYRILLKGLEASTSLRDRALEVAYRPELHFGLVEGLAQEQAITSSMDSSDGLGITLNTMSRLSDHGFVIDRLPLGPGIDEFARQHRLDSVDLVMNGGEEFSVVLTIPPDRLQIADRISKRKGCSLQYIGRVTDDTPGVKYVSGQGEKLIPDRGYDDFREWD